MNRRFGTSLLAAGALALCGVAPVHAQELANEGPVPTTALIRVDKNAPVSASTLTLQVNGRNTPVESLQPVGAQNTEVAILIDEGLRASVANQLGDLAKFIQSLPPGVRVLVGYMRNGAVRYGRGFTTDHAELTGQLRMPLSSPGVSASPYFCLSDFVKHWPSQERAARFVLMISNGVDPYNGSTSVMNQDSPYVQAAQDDAQRAGVAVYTLYYGDAGIRGRSASFSGQSYLTQVAEATGGENLYTGTIMPPSFAPFLRQFTRDMEESYLLGFRANATRQKGNTLASIKVRSTTGARIHAPEAVHPGLVE